MSLLAANEGRGTALSELVTQFQENGNRLDASQPGAPAGKKAVGALAVVRIRTPWTIARKTDDAGASATALGERLQQGDDDADNPLTNADYKFAVSSSTPTTVVVSDDAEDLLYEGTQIALSGTSSDGWYTVAAVSTASGSTTITVVEPLPTNAGGGFVIIPRAVGRVGSSRLVTAVSRSRHDIAIVANVGGEFVMLNRPRCWVILSGTLAAATVVTVGSAKRLRPATVEATMLVEPPNGDANPDDLLLSDEPPLLVGNYDERMVLAPNTVCEVALGSRFWTPVWAGCNVSALRIG